MLTLLAKNILFFIWRLFVPKKTEPERLGILTYDNNSIASDWTTSRFFVVFEELMVVGDAIKIKILDVQRTGCGGGRDTDDDCMKILKLEGNNRIRWVNRNGTTVYSISYETTDQQGERLDHTRLLVTVPTNKLIHDFLKK